MRRVSIMAVVGLVAGMLTVVSTASPSAAAGPIIYVDVAADGANTGASWGDAFTDLQDALAAASAGDEIRVAEGTYTPHASDRSVSFELVDGVTLTGGYAAGGAAGPEPAVYPTILSGDLNGDDLPDFVNNDDNSRRVVVGDSSIVTGAVLDGFTVTAGNGGGMGLHDTVNVTIANSTISWNTGNSGAGIANTSSSSLGRQSPLIINTTISNNVASGIEAPASLGGGIYNRRSSPTIVNSVIENNTGDVIGGGIYNDEGSRPRIVNSVVSSNSGGGIVSRIFGGVTITNSMLSDNEGVGIRIGEFGWVKVTNSIIWGNTLGVGIGGYPGYSTVSYSNVEGWTAGGVGNIDANPLFAGPGDYRLQPGSPAVDAGDDTAVPPDVFDVDGDGDTTEPTPDLDLNDRIQGAAVDMGAYELQPPPNVAPVADADGPYLGAVGTPIVFDGSSSFDPDGAELRFDWDWGDGTAATDAGPTPTHSYDAAGFYDVCVRVTDPAGASDTACGEAVVFDPAAGFVTGGGWIDSPEGAYVPDPSLTGRLSFGFVSRYPKTAGTPTGNVTVQFRAAGLKFKATSFDWLVLPGDDTAVLTGTGTINRTGDYRFTLWLSDGDPDTVRLRIWTGAGGETVVYDSGGQDLGGGDIVVHTKGK